MDHEEFDRLELAGEWLCDVDLIPAADSPGTIESPWGATSVGYIESGEFRGPKLNGRVLPGGGGHGEEGGHAGAAAVAAAGAEGERQAYGNDEVQTRSRSLSPLGERFSRGNGGRKAPRFFRFPRF